MPTVTPEDLLSYLTDERRDAKLESTEAQLQAIEAEAIAYRRILDELADRLDDMIPAGVSTDVAADIFAAGLAGARDRWKAAYEQANRQAGELEAEASDLRQLLADVCRHLGADPVPSTDEGMAAYVRGVLPLWERQKDAPVPDEDGWIPHDGRSWPACRPSDCVEVRYRDGERDGGIAGRLSWRHQGDVTDIVQWSRRPIPDVAF